MSTEPTSRLEAFSDGVFAIAITLLILEIRVPHAGAEGDLWAGLVALWPSYLAFVLSFFVILIMWVNHHELMRQVRAVGYPFFFANGFVLLTVTFVPFPTAVLAEHLATAEARAAVTFYCGTFVSMVCRGVCCSGRSCAVDCFGRTSMLRPLGAFAAPISLGRLCISSRRWWLWCNRRWDSRSMYRSGCCESVSAITPATGRASETHGSPHDWSRVPSATFGPRAGSAAWRLAFSHGPGFGSR